GGSTASERMDKDHSNQLLEPQVALLEQALKKLQSESVVPEDFEHARNALHVAISSVCDLIPSKRTTYKLSDLLDAASKASKGKRAAAELVTRTASIDGVLESSNDDLLPLRIVALVESAAPDLCKYLRLGDKRQTYEKFNAIKGAHALVCSNIQVLQKLP